MVDDGGGESVVSAELPESTVEWLDEQAAEREITSEEFLRRLVAAYRTVDDEETEVATPEDLDALAERIDSVDEEVEEKIDDVRQRVVQVKREADAKAPADHDHSDIARRLQRVSTTAEATQSDLAEMREELEVLRATTERGFENYEEVLEYLTETTGEVEERLTRVATALVYTRRVVGDIAAVEEDREALESVLRAANQRGITTADCEACDGTVDLGLLTEPACPHCESPINGVEPKSGYLFGSATLTTGSPSTLTAGNDAGGIAVEPEDDVDTEDAVSELLEDESLAGLGDGSEAPDAVETLEEEPLTATTDDGSTERDDG
jgi:DNA repair exonuclease SbcCD ATPase subunit